MAAMTSCENTQYIVQDSTSIYDSTIQSSISRLYYFLKILLFPH